MHASPRNNYGKGACRGGGGGWNNEARCPELLSALAKAHSRCLPPERDCGECQGVQLGLRSPSGRFKAVFADTVCCWAALEAKCTLRVRLPWCVNDCGLQRGDRQGTEHALKSRKLI